MLGLPQRHDRSKRLAHATFDLVLARQLEQAASSERLELDTRDARPMVPGQPGHLPGVAHLVARRRSCAS
jgi:hypothetical protein